MDHPLFSRVTVVVLALLLTAFCMSAVLPVIGAGASAAGTGWQAEASNVAADLHSVSAVDTTTAWAVGASRTILRTGDGGANWSPQSIPWVFPPPGSPITPNISSVASASSQKAWAGGDFYSLFRTVDAGSTWESLTGFGSAGEVSVTSIDPVGDDSLWLIVAYELPSSGGYVWYVWVERADGWTPGTTPPLFADNPTAYLSGLGKFMPGWIFTQVSAVDANNAWAVGTAGHILHFAGGAWTQQTSGTSIDLSSVSAVNLQTAWAVGRGGTILKTFNGGSTWVAQTSGVTADLNHISAVDANIAWAVGAGGMVLKTEDGGATWVAQESGTTSNLYSVSAVDPNNAWAVGAGGTILHTTDGGAGQPIPAVPTVESINPASATNLLGTAVTISGTGFRAGASVKFEKGSTVFSSIGVTVASDKRITCHLLTSGQSPGKYDVVVTNPDGQESKLAGGFTVTDVCGQGGGAAISLFAGLLGLMTLAGFGWRRGRR